MKYFIVIWTLLFFSPNSMASPYSSCFSEVNSLTMKLMGFKIDLDTQDLDRVRIENAFNHSDFLHMPRNITMKRSTDENKLLTVGQKGNYKLEAGDHVKANYEVEKTAEGLKPISLEIKGAKSEQTVSVEFTMKGERCYIESAKLTHKGVERPGFSLNQCVEVLSYTPNGKTNHELYKNYNSAERIAMARYISRIGKDAADELEVNRLASNTHKLSEALQSLYFHYCTVGGAYSVHHSDKGLLLEEGHYLRTRTDDRLKQDSSERVVDDTNGSAAN